MGWDAWALNNGKRLSIDWENRRLKKFEYRNAFSSAFHRARAKADGVDAFLIVGALDCSKCGEFLEQATGIDAWGVSLSPEDVQRAGGAANWDFEYLPDDAGLYWSARFFLSTCSKLNLGIEFTY